MTAPDNLSLFGTPEQGSDDQMRLREMQLFNWGTFSGYLRISIAKEGYLFVGPSGSGKSTILDAHASLTTPPRWVDFNVAAREAERRSKDRNLMTYVRGAWAQQTSESGEYAAQFLRSDTTWSAAAETYRDESGKVVVLAQVIWVRGKTTSPGEVKKLYLVLEREFDLRELKFFADQDFDTRRFKFDLPDAFVRDEFSAYQERFRRLLGIDSERALRLLHKTQGAKNLGDLNEFMRDFMLDPPHTFELAEKLVQQFDELNDAHRAVVSARRQIETLKPARDESMLLDKARTKKSELDELNLGVDKYKERQRKRLLDEAIERTNTAIEGQAQETELLEQQEKAAFAELRSLQDQRAQMGGSLLEDLQVQLTTAEKLREKRGGKRESIAHSCRVMGWTLPENATNYAGRKDAAKAFVHGSNEVGAKFEEQKIALSIQFTDAGKELEKTKQEVAALERQRSNIPSRMLNVRERMALELGIPEEKLPFAGELMEVRKEDAEWRGAIERVLNGFAQSLLVDEKHYSQVASYLNTTHIGERVVYYKTMNQTAAQRSVGPDSLIRKLQFAQVPQAEWVREELKSHFDYECAATLQAFRSAHRAITREGQVKHNATRHEKNDRFRVDDQSKWVLGMDNASKRAYFKNLAFEQATEWERLRVALTALDEERNKAQDRMKACILVANTEWDELDVNASIAQIDGLQARIKREQESRPDLGKLDEDIKRQEKNYDEARDAHSNGKASLKTLENWLTDYTGRLGRLREELLSVALTPLQSSGLDERYSYYQHELTLDNLDAATTHVVRGIATGLGELQKEIQSLVTSIERRFEEFVRLWPAEAGGLDAKIASEQDFFAKLERLEKDGLPEYEERFLKLLREQSEQNLTRLSTQLDQERKAIRDRMTVVNESLATTQFGQGTYLVIDTADKLMADVTEFKQQLRSAMSNMLSQDAASAEQRFEAISGLVKRLASQETPDKNWRNIVLDVRQHVEFIARELDKDGIEQEVYRSGAGKSGGQRQKLAATCLAAALRYQLGGQDRALPRFCTVFLDEAFDKADAEFTTMAMNIFKTFGFQLVVATPMKSVMTLEPFIGGACFVHIKDRKFSHVIPIDYDSDSKRLKLGAQKHDEETAEA